MKRVRLMGGLLAVCMLFSMAGCVENETQQAEEQGADQSSAQVGSYITLGSYEQDKDASDGKEPIEWLVLATEGDKALVVSRYCLDCQPYNTEYGDLTWETCSLRTWLNTTFLNEAFSAEEQSSIINATIVNDPNPMYPDTPSGNDTTDQIFLLSVTEVEKYFDSDSARECDPTKSAVAHGVYVRDGNTTCYWWLRSPGDMSNSAVCVGFDGSWNNVPYVHSDVNGIRPAMWINI